MMKKYYEVSLSGFFRADNEEDAVKAMIDWINEGYASSGVYFVRDENQNITCIDGEDLNYN